MPLIIVEPPGTFGTSYHFLKAGRHWTDDPELIRAVQDSDLDWVYIVESPELDEQRAGETPSRAIISTSTPQDESGRLTSADVDPAKIAATLACPHCAKPFRNKAALASHVRARHAAIQPEAPVAPRVSPPVEPPVATEPPAPKTGALTTDDLPTT